MRQLTFEHIYVPGDIYDENDLYRHIHYPEMLVRYDSNFIEFKRIPSLAEFKEAADYLRQFHIAKGQKHVKFYFPGNEKPPEQLLEFFRESGYEYGFMELYTIEPDQFPDVESNPYIEVQNVTDENFATFADMQYQQDAAFGREFARQKQEMIKRQYQDDKFIKLIACYKGTPAGTVEVVISDDIVEIDNLNVEEACQRKGIGSRLQKYVMDLFPEKIVILVADGEDTPREMYQKQGYQYIGYKYEVQKIYAD